MSIPMKRAKRRHQRARRRHQRARRRIHTHRGTLMVTIGFDASEFIDSIRAAKMLRHLRAAGSSADDFAQAMRALGNAATGTAAAFTRSSNAIREGR